MRNDRKVDFLEVGTGTGKDAEGRPERGCTFLSVREKGNEKRENGQIMLLPPPPRLLSNPLPVSARTVPLSARS